jgi:CCR4-NOT transcription complex subunit 6
LQKAGYVAIYKKKTTEVFVDNKWVAAAPLLHQVHCQGPVLNLWAAFVSLCRYAIDGCATFFRRDRFSLVKKYEVRTTTDMAA